MKSILTTIFLFLFANSAFAANLCDTSCNLTITFPSGGSITAVESMMFTFGDGGLVDTVATNTAYVQGNTLMLGVGEVLTFGAGGSFDLGTGGNLDYTNITVTTEGDIDIQSVGGTESVLLSGITIVGTGTLTITGSNIVIDGDISTDSDVFIIATGSVTESSGTITASLLNITAGSIGATGDPIVTNAYTLSLTTTGDIYASSTGSISLDSSISTTCTTASDGSITVSTTTTPTISTCNTISIGGTITFVPPEAFVINPVELSILELPTLDDGDVYTFWDERTCVVQGDQCIADDGTIYKVIDSIFVIDPYVLQRPMLQGLELDTKDGNKCTVTDGKCIDENGVEYKMNEDGELVPVESGSGSLNITVLLFAFFSLLYTRRFTSGHI